MHCRGLWKPLVALCVLLSGWASSAMACVGVVTASFTPYWSQVEAGARQAWAENRLEVLVRGPTHEGSVETQLEMIDWVLARGCRTLVIAPSGEEITRRVNQLSASGITTIFFDRDMPGSVARGLVATDNYRAGEQAGQYLVRALGGRGSVALLRLRPDVTSTTERERGFRQAAEAGGLQVLLDVYVGEDRQLAVQALQGQVDQLDGLFTPNSTSSRAVLAALRRLGKTGQLLHVGFDGDPLLIEALRSGEIHSLYIQQAHLLGFRAVQLAARAARGELPAERVVVALDAERIDQGNLAQWEQTQLQNTLSGQP